MIITIDDLGQYIKNKRKMQNLSLKTVATLCDVSLSYISRIENNSSTPSLETLMKISNILNFDINEVCDLSDESDFGKKEDVSLEELLFKYNIMINNKTINNVEKSKIVNLLKLIYSTDWTNTEQLLNKMFYAMRIVEKMNNKGDIEIDIEMD